MGTFNNSIEGDIFLKVRNRIYISHNKIHNCFTSLCNEFVRVLCENEIDRLSQK